MSDSRLAKLVYAGWYLAITWVSLRHTIYLSFSRIVVRYGTRRGDYGTYRGKVRVLRSACFLGFLGGLEFRVVHALFSRLLQAYLLAILMSWTCGDLLIAVHI